MATTEVYTPTTAPNPKSSCLSVPSQYLDKMRFYIKIVEVLLSFVAFVLEEVVNSCDRCSALYFFEFVSCTAFLFTLLLLVLLSTPLHSRVGITCWSQLDFVYTVFITVLFFIASCVFASSNSGMSIERSAVAFGFLATAAFMVDLFFFWRTNGFPFSSQSKAQARNDDQSEAERGGTADSQPPEMEKLNGAE